MVKDTGDSKMITEELGVYTHRDTERSEDKKEKIVAKNLNLWFGDKHVLINNNIAIKENVVTAVMGPSGCGKSTFIRCINRMNDLIDDCKIEGQIFIQDKDIYSENTDVYELRKQVGMVFQKPNPLPKSIFENIAYGLKLHGITNRREIHERIEKSLIDANLLDEVKDRLNTSALELSGGQQQRLCLARALAIEPEIILLDEPASALDPISTAKLEELLEELKKHYTIVIVTHNMQQAARVSDYAAFLMLGEFIEIGPTERIFTAPKDKRTENYLIGKFG
jgi:phosphate transport system ATP-binding protein